MHPAKRALARAAKAERAKTKGPAILAGPLSSLYRELLSNDADILAVIRAFNFEFDLAFSGSEQGVVFATTYVLTSVELGATLTNDDATSQRNKKAEPPLEPTK